MRVQWGGDPMHPGTPRRAVAAKVFSPLPKARGLLSALVWWRFMRVSPQFLAPGQAHPCRLPCPSIPRCLRVPVGVPTRGCAREAAPLLHHHLVRNTMGRATFPPLAGLMCTDWVSSRLRSPAWDCYPLASLVFPNLYICFCKFSGKLRSNLFHPVIPSLPPSPPPRTLYFFFSRHILHYVKRRWKHIFGKSNLPFCLQHQGLDLAAYLIKGGSCTF